MISETEKIINRIFEQAKLGKVVIGKGSESEWPFYSQFSVNINGKINSQDHEIVLNIPNYDKFVNLVDTYLEKAKLFYDDDKDYFDLNDNSFVEKLFHDLIVDMSAGDLNNVEKYISTRTKMIDNNLQDENFNLPDFMGYKTFVRVRKNASNFESPLFFQVIFSEENKGTFVLPAVLFGIADDTAIVHGVQNLTKKNKTDVEKKLDRYFRKVNKDIDSDDIIANISPNALVSFTMFVEYLKQKGIKHVEVKDFFPLRYIAKENALKKHFASEELESFVQKQERDQFNMTNKLLYLALRYGEHFPESKPYFDENDGVMHLDLSQKTKFSDENIIYDIAKFSQNRPKTAENLRN